MAENNINGNLTIKHEPVEGQQIDLFRLLCVMTHNWLRLVLLTLLIGGLTAIGVQYFYNKPKANYLCDFILYVPSYEGNSMIDGTKFTYSDLVSKDVLSYVKDSKKEEYASIDVDKMASENKAKISIVKVYDEKDDTKIDSTHYEISIAQSCFSDENIAREFITDITNYPLNYNLSVQKNLYYEGHFASYNSARTYETQISSLQSQISWLNSKYNSIISNYGDFVLSNSENEGKTVSEVLRIVNDYFANHPLSDLSRELSENGYVMSSNELKSLSFQKTNLERSLEYAKTEIDDLQEKIDNILDKTGGSGQSLDIDAYVSKITSLTAEEMDYQTQIDSINRKLLIDPTHPMTSETKTQPDSGSAIDAFKATLSSYYDYLYQATENLKNNNEPEALKNYSKVNYLNSSVIVKDGGLSLVVTCLLSGFAGLIISMAINGLADHKYMHEPFPSKKKEEKAAKYSRYFDIT